MFFFSSAFIFLRFAYLFDNRRFGDHAQLLDTGAFNLGHHLNNDAIGNVLIGFQVNFPIAEALKHFIQYYAEVKKEETVGIRIRLLGRSDKRLHFMAFMINESTGRLASTMEVLGTHADLTVRRASPLAPSIAKKIDEKLAKDAALDWEAPVSGVIKL